ncbi:putative lipid II flippase FtsW [Chakrabartyella piscis]|uniref:putative lipid II flippase FtsW n=1 Tax=Chakrabartyella piscis TaxID=2918914 RepID=UPI002958ACFB|nr:putative lipid II flippase FtsW [Chakrabartyella piscis]
MDQGRKKQPTYTQKHLGPSSFDFTVLFITITLMLFGVVMIFSASYYTTMISTEYNNDMFYYLKKQGQWVALSLVAILVVMAVPYTKFRRISFLGYWVSNFMLALLWIPGVGIEAGGQVRWLGIPGVVQFQPSEVTKCALAIYFSHYIVKHRNEMNTFKGFVKALAILGIPVVLIAKSNFSSALLVLLMGLAMLFVGAPKIRYLVAGALAMIPLGALAVVNFSYRMSRITIWQDPWSDPTGDGYQIIQGLYAVASGGVFGLGLGQSRQKTFVPESHNDIIFSIICEELGLLGAGLVIMLFAILIWRGVRIAIRARDLYGTLVATGIISVIAFQAIINMGVVTNTIPNTGQPLPFISYGGTSLLFLAIMIGILLNVSKTQREK